MYALEMYTAYLLARGQEIEDFSYEHATASSGHITD